ncbi:PLP-dependent aminotransferase family protein [Streptomyces sp. ALI-76-A]|uniref:MocR-like pyridoxine biosynthesis transcription factor PdxR n=1 Tax=Streptomyces sp. ALI-76-A TaxID=3025736 RepID=UPI00256F05C9|nr:PLP-dependent aminotransferase family protein [Streptomyces sp. ALI-76-A]MDL5206131.1 PLP-dependent aminotransferase family protein [Streptomyces sp. ALI-76-A]
MEESRTNLAWSVLLDLPGTGAKHERLTRALRMAVRSGRLPAGSALPPSRTLAADLGCSRWVVTQAYTQLVAEGYLDARVGSATRVRWTPDTVPTPSDADRPPAPQTRFDLTPGLPDLRAFPRARWGEAVRDQARRAPLPDLGFPPPGGHPELRRVLTDHLHRSRGVVVDTDDIVVSTGVTDGAARLFRALRAEGITRVAVEDPGWTRLHHVAREAGLTVVPVPVDEQGLRVAELDRDPTVRVVLTTPAHQFPTGVTLSAERRAALVEWVRRIDGVVLEDDYDAEFRYDHRPLGAVQGMCPQRVVLLGSVSKTLSPALGIGWVVAPPRWRRVLQASGTFRSGPPVLDQLAFARLVRTGGYDRHLRSVRQRYRARRAALLDALRTRLPTCRVTGSAAGLHMVAHLGHGVDAADVVTAAAARGLRLVDLGTYRVDHREPADCLVLGYGNLADGAVDDAVVMLAASVADQSAHDSGPPR